MPRTVLRLPERGHPSTQVHSRTAWEPGMVGSPASCLSPGEHVGSRVAEPITQARCEHTPLCHQRHVQRYPLRMGTYKFVRIFAYGEKMEGKVNNKPETLHGPVCPGLRSTVTVCSPSERFLFSGRYQVNEICKSKKPRDSRRGYFKRASAMRISMIILISLQHVQNKAQNHPPGV